MNVIDVKATLNKFNVNSVIFECVFMFFLLSVVIFKRVHEKIVKR